MHEYGITERLFQIALSQADLRDGERIRRLTINLDPNAGYAPDAIRFYFEQLAKNTPAEGAELAFELGPQPQHIALHQLEIDDVSAGALADEKGEKPCPHASSVPTGADALCSDSTSPIARWHLHVSGVVQGVGFRPFLHNLAHQLNLSGWIRNTSGGVELELQGPGAELNHFLVHLRRDAPPLARILDIETTPVPPLPDPPAGLAIRASQNQAGRTLISPDVAVCPRCLSELFDPADRRSGYAFTNCTHCGPRFTIITGLPYDRPLTTMADFPLCPACAAEYGRPDDRRFHAQPVACPTCGPTVWFAQTETTPDLTAESLTNAAALDVAVRCLNLGGILAVKGLGGFHLACRAADPLAVRRLRANKYRPAKPLAVMVRSLAEAAEFCHLGPAEQALLAAPEAPIVLLRKRTDPAAGHLAPDIAPENGYIGVILPYTPLHHLLLQAAGGPLVMTSGNRSGEPLCIDNAEAWAKLSAYADGFLFHNRPIARRCDDSVMLVANLGRQAITQPVRRSRGLVPLPILLPPALNLAVPIVAAGADLKNVPALAMDRQVFLTQHIGDLSNLAAREEHSHAIADFERLFRGQPQALVCDLHPDYASSRYARRRAEQEGLPLIEVQHHHAHIAGCMAENNHTGPTIGLSFDGTGYGPDGCIWGGEVLLADLNDFERCYHLEYLPLPGGDAATRHPQRIALAYLRTLLPQLDVLSVLPGLEEQEVTILDTMLAQRLNTPLTSSMGRLFDAVSALLGLGQEVTFEGQAAIALEAAALASNFEGPGYDFELDQDKIRLAPLFSQLLADRQTGRAGPDLARRFHQTVARMAIAAANAVRTGTGGINHVALSGGVWQNRLLLEMTVRGLEEAGFEVLLHHAVPANDGGLAYGQVAVAAARLAAQPTKKGGA